MDSGMFESRAALARYLGVSQAKCCIDDDTHTKLTVKLTTNRSFPAPDAGDKKFNSRLVAPT
jgi:hypothetical protein